jgi:hypothetical protein
MLSPIIQRIEAMVNQRKLGWARTANEVEDCGI